MNWGNFYDWWWLNRLARGRAPIAQNLKLSPSERATRVSSRDASASKKPSFCNDCLRGWTKFVRPSPQLCQFTIQPNIQNCSGTKIYFHFRIEIVCWCCPCIVRSTESESLSSFPSLADQLRETQLKHRKSTSKVYFADLVSSTFRILQNCIS